MKGGVFMDKIKNVLIRALMTNTPSRNIKRMIKLGMLPDIEKMAGFNQNNKNHHLDLLDHTLSALDNSFKSLPVRLSLLFHDIGKIDTKQIKSNGEFSFIGHEITSAIKAKEIMTILKFDNDLINLIVNIIKNHNIQYTSQWTNRAVRRFMKKNHDWLNYLFLVWIADRQAYKNIGDIDLINRIYNIMLDN